MSQIYTLRDGTEVTTEQIRQAWSNGMARLVISYDRNCGFSTGLMLDGRDIDTRGECYSMSDEVWSTTPKSLSQCYAYAR